MKLIKYLLAIVISLVSLAKANESAAQGTMVQNQAPMAAADFATTYSASEVVIAVLRNDTDEDGSIESSSVTVTQPSSGGTATVNTSGAITFRPEPNFSGDASFSYTIRDNFGAQSNPATVSVRVIRNQQPTISDISNISLNLGVAGSPVSFQVSDPDGETLTVTASAADPSLVASVALSGSGSNRSLNLRAGNIAGATTVTLTASDGVTAPVTRTFNVAVFALIDAGTASPVAGALADRTFRNSVGTDFSTGSSVSVAPNSLAATVPEQLFRTVSFDSPGGEELKFSIPTKAGQRYQVDLFFSEIWSGANGANKRVFNVLLEGTAVLSSFDVFSQAGGINKGIGRRFEVNGDGIVNIELVHGIQNPAIAGIRVAPLIGSN